MKERNPGHSWSRHWRLSMMSSWATSGPLLCSMLRFGLWGSAIWCLTYWKKPAEWLPVFDQLFRVSFQQLPLNILATLSLFSARFNNNVLRMDLVYLDMCFRDELRVRKPCLSARVQLSLYLYLYQYWSIYLSIDMYISIYGNNIYIYKYTIYTRKLWERVLVQFLPFWKLGAGPICYWIFLL